MSSPPIEVDLDVPRGADWTQGFVWSFSDLLTLVDVSTAAVRWTIRTSRDTVNGPVTLALTVGAGVAVAGGGSITLALTKTQSAAIAQAQKYFHDVYIDFVSGNTVLLMVGRVVFL
jgi:hypothetical protein